MNELINSLKETIRLKLIKLKLVKYRGLSQRQFQVSPAKAVMLALLLATPFIPVFLHAATSSPAYTVQAETEGETDPFITSLNSLKDELERKSNRTDQIMSEQARAIEQLNSQNYVLSETIESESDNDDDDDDKEDDDEEDDDDDRKPRRNRD